MRPIGLTLSHANYLLKFCNFSVILTEFGCQQSVARGQRYFSAILTEFGCQQSVARGQRYFSAILTEFGWQQSVARGQRYMHGRKSYHANKYSPFVSVEIALVYYDTVDTEKEKRLG